MALLASPAPPIRAAASRPAAEKTPLLKDNKYGSAAFFGDPIAWTTRLAENVPPPLLASIFLTQHLLKGLVAGGGDEGLIGKPAEFLLAAHHVSAGRLQSMIAVGAQSPWVLKPLIGFLSDAIPIWGYKKNPYLMIMTVLSCSAVAFLAADFARTPQVIIVCLFFASLQVAGSTLLVDAKQSELTKVHPSLGPELVTFRETCMNSGMIFSALIAGPLISFISPHAPYYAAFPLIASLLVMASRNWLQEQRLVAGEDRINLQRVRQNWPLFCLGLTLVPLLLVLALGSAAYLNSRTMAILAASATFVVVAGYGLLIRGAISGPIIFFFLVRCLNPQISGAMFYFFTDPPEAFPEGPHFSPFFYVTGVTAVAVAGRMIGILTAKELFGNWHYARALKVAIPTVAFTQCLLLPLLLRWNLHLGVPDHAWVLAWTFIDMIARGWRQFPLSVVLLHATPRGLEASSVALNSGAINMGITLSFFFGGFLLRMCGVNPAGFPQESLAFSGLWKAQLAAALSPLVAIFLMPMLMPVCSQTEALIVDNPTSATHGAPLQRWFGTDDDVGV